MTKRPNIRKHFRAKGEVYVWITSMGLTTGLVMVVALLALIVINGTSSFWPKDVALIRFDENSPTASTTGTEMAGEIVKERYQRGLSSNEPPVKEIQLFVGNRDAYGASFKYFPAADIASIAYPGDLMVVERMEYGDAQGFPKTLVLPDGSTIPAEDTLFAKELARAVKVANARRDEIGHIEKKEIGAINSQMTHLRNRLRGLEKEGAMESGEAKAIEQKLSALQTEYEVLAEKAKALRETQKQGALEIRLASGQDRKIPLGDIVGFSFPNQLGFGGKLALFLQNFWNFLTEDPREANTEGGIFPALFGTFVMTLLMSVAVVPFGVVAAIYLREYAVQGFLVRSVRIAVNNLAGVPSIVFGVFGLGFFVYFLGGTIDSLLFKDALPTPTFGTGGIFWAALTLALMTVPVVIVATEEALASVPRGVREGSLACGASKWQTIQRLVLPAAAPGILTGLILAMARGAGEVAPLMLVGVVKLAPSLPIDTEFPFIHLERKFMHLGFHIYDLGFQSPDSEAARPMVFATTLLLIMLVVVLNLTAILLRERLRKKYASGTF